MTDTEPKTEDIVASEVEFTQEQKQALADNEPDLPVPNVQDVIRSDDPFAVLNSINAVFFAPYCLVAPDNVVNALSAASKLTGNDRVAMIRKAVDKAQIMFYGAWARGTIKVKTKFTKAMTPETKQKLKEINKQKREEREKKQLKPQLSVQTKGVRDTMADTTATAPVAAPATPPVATPKVAKEKKARTPAYKDVAKQAETCAKYSWVIAGTFKQDPAKEGGTLVDIKCVKCGKTRSIHLADAFQVKLCADCKSAEKPVKKEKPAEAPKAPAAS